MGEQTDRETQEGRHRHNLSIPYVNGGTLIFQLPPIKINIQLLYACILAQNIEEMSGRTDTGRQAQT